MTYYITIGYYIFTLEKAPRRSERQEDEMTIPDSAVRPGTSPIQKLTYKRKEGAEMLSVSLRTLDTMIATNQLRVVRVGRSVLIPLDSLQTFLEHDHGTEGGLVQ